MSMRPKTKRRLGILITLVLLIIVAVSGLIFLQKHRNAQRLLTLRETGMRLYHAGDYEGALKPLSEYHTKHPNDPESRFAFAVSRSKVPSSGNYLGEAIQHLQYYVAQRPDELGAKHFLLDLYNQVGFDTEAVQLADELLKHDPDDINAIKNKAMAKYRLQKYDETLTLSERLNELSPLDLEGQLLTYQTLYNLRRPVEEVLQRAEKQRLDHPDDPRFELLQAYALLYANKIPDALQWLDKAAAHKLTDIETILQLTRVYDQLQKFDKAQAVLETSLKNVDDIRLTQALIQRLWRAMRYQDVISHTQNLDITSTRTDTQLLAYRAYALYELQHPEEARAITDALSKRKGDDEARAWALALTARYENPNEDVRQKIDQYQAAISRAPRNAVIRYLLGDAYLYMHENELALDSWQKALDLDPSWALPHSQRARLLASTGRIDAAIAEAQTAMRRSPTAASAIAFSLATYYKAIQTGAASDYDRALKVAQSLQQQIPNEPQTLPVYVTLLAHDGQKDKAVAAIKSLLASRTTPPLTLLINLSGINRRYALGMENALFDTAQNTYGQTAELAYARAMDQYAAGDAQQGIQTLKTALAGVPSDKALPYRLAFSQYLETINDPGARDTWVALGEEFQDNLNIQTAILNAESPHEDRQFMRKTIDRVRKLTGDQANVWRIAQARWLLEDTQSAPIDHDRDVASAIVMLSDMVRTSPTLVEPRLLLAKAMEQTNNPTGAIAQLQDALRLRADSAQILIELARIYQDQSKFDDAASSLDTAAANNSLTARQRLTIAAMYANQAEYAKALKLLQAIPTAQRNTQVQLLTAQLYRQTGAFDQARAIYTQLLADAPNATAIRAAADLDASTGHLNQALDTLKKLDQLPGMTVWARQLILADFASRYQGADQAVAHYQAAIKDAPDAPEPYTALASYYIRQGKFSDAVATANQGLEQVPGNAALTTLRDRSNALSRDGSIDLKDVISTLSDDPRNQAAVETLRIIEDARTNNEPAAQTAGKLADVADRHTHYLPVYRELVRRYLTLGQADQATAYAQRAMDYLPTNPDAAQLATEAYAATRKPTQMLTAAQAWRSRSLENPQRADMAIADAELTMGRSQAALAQLQPYVAGIKENPQASVGLTTVYARALLLANQPQQVQQMLLPLAQKDSQWRLVWLRLLSVAPRNTDADSAWIQQVAPYMSKDNSGDQLALGRAWYDLAMRYTSQPAMKNAHAIFTELTQAPDAPAALYMLLGSTSEFLGDWPGAETAYRQSVAKDPKNSIAMNQLANALLHRNEKLDQALELARQATSISPQVSPMWDTLARIYDKMGNTQEALNTFQKAVSIQPSNVEALIGLASTMVRLNHMDDARQTMRTVENLVQGADKLPDAVTQQLAQVRKALQ